jgi:hypothetical protein
LPDNDFHSRLQRIGAKQGTGPSVANGSARKGNWAPNLVRMIIAVLVILTGSGIVRFANENYETLRADGGVELAVGVGLASFATIILGVVLFWRSVQTRLEPQPQMARPYHASAGSRGWSSFIGFALGVFACVAMFAAAAARLVNPDTGNVFSGLALLAALSITVMALLIGIVGLFLRGRSLHRVPLYFLAGGILTYCIF